MPNDNREAALVNAFVVKGKRERYTDLLNNPKKRKKILGLLNHNFDFREELSTSIFDHQILDRLQGCKELLDAGHLCYLISDDSELDGKMLPFADALALARTSYWGTILDCIPGQLALYWSEAFPNRVCLLLQKRSPVQNEL